MRDPQIVETATLAPGKCFVSGSITGPFVDTMIDMPFPEGRIYVAEHVLQQWDRLRGTLDTAATAELKAEHEEALSKIAVLEAELEVERSPAAKIVTVEQAIEMAKVVSLDAARAKKAEKPKAAA